MKKFLGILSVVMMLAVGMISSCEKLETYSELPEVSFLSVYIADTVDNLGNEVKLQRLKLEVIDGDGNLGLNASDSTGNFSSDSLYTNNLFITASNKESDGTYRTIESLTGKYRIPYQAPLGQNKYLKAEITVKIETPIAFISSYDTIRYEIHVIDRALNISPTEISCDIPIKEHGSVWADGTTSFVEKPKPEEDTENTEESETTSGE